MNGNLSYEEARRLAISVGALKPQGMTERMAAGVMSYNGGSWSHTERAQARLQDWTQAILNGANPYSLK